MPFEKGVQDSILKVESDYKVRWEGDLEYTLVTFTKVTETGYNFVDKSGKSFLKSNLYDSGYLTNKPGFIKVYLSNKLTIRPGNFIPKSW